MAQCLMTRVDYMAIFRIGYNRYSDDCFVMKNRYSKAKQKCKICNEYLLRFSMVIAVIDLFLISVTRKINY